MSKKKQLANSDKNTSNVSDNSNNNINKNLKDNNQNKDNKDKETNKEAPNCNCSVASQQSCDNPFAGFSIGNKFLSSILSPLTKFHTLRLIALGIVSAVVLSLCFPFTRQTYLVWFALIPLFLAVRNHGALKGALTFFTFSFVFHLITLYWIGVFGSIAHIGLAFEKALIPAVVGGFLGTYTSRSPWLNTLITASLWVFMEYLQTLGYFGMTWGMLANTKARSPVFLQINTIFGMWGLSFVIAWVNSSIVEYILASYEFCRKNKDLDEDYGTSLKHVSISTKPITVALLLIFFTLGFGLLRLNFLPPNDNGDVNWGVVQLSTPQRQKFDPAYAPKILDELEEMTSRAAKEGANVVVWPETSLPYRDFLTTKPLTDRIRRFVKNTNIWLILGSIETQDNGSSKNAVTIWSPEGKMQGRYDKVHLVPFGEFLPWKEYWPNIPGIEKVMNYEPGRGSYCLEFDHDSNPLTDSYKAGILICFETMCTYLPRQHVINGAQFLVIPTNDAWFGNTTELPSHFDMAIMRAVELGRPAIQVGNTGISGFVNSQGFVLQETKANETKMLVEPLWPKYEYTFYAKNGDYFPWICFVVALFIAFSDFFKRNIKVSDNSLK